MDTTHIKTTISPLRILVVLRNPQANPFVSIITEEITSKDFIVDTDVDSFWKKRKEYDIIQIHWPDFLNPQNGLEPPSEEFGRKLSKVLKFWKAAGSRIIYTRHDETTHYEKEGARLHLFTIVENHADIIIHLGDYSMQQMLKKKVNLKQFHTLIPHHIYDTLYTNSISQEEAREVLNIPLEKKVILTFGSYRDEEEHILVKQAFEALDIPEKYLLAPGWKHDGWNKYYNKKIGVEGEAFLGKGTVDKDMLPYCFAAANVVFIQRVRNLNSGNLPLAFLFNKTVVGPNIGNIGGFLDNENNFSFDPLDLSSIVLSLKRGIERSQNPQTNEAYARKYWNTAKIVKQYKDIYRTQQKETIQDIRKSINLKKICWHNEKAQKEFISVHEAKKKEKNNRAYLEEHYLDCVSSFYKSSDFENITDSNYPVWVYWEQGEENMPEVVRMCYLSLLQNSNNHPIYLLTKQNYKEFVQIPNHILKKRENGIIPIAQFSDFLRISLLAQQGGLWLDATVLVTSNLPNFEQELFSIKNHTDYEYISQFRWSSFLLYCTKGNTLFQFVEKLLTSYWERENTLIDYLLLDYVIDMAYKHIPEVKVMIDQIPFSNEGVWDLKKICHHPIEFNSSFYQQLTENTQFHKFTITDDYFRETNSTYEYLKNKYIR